jgi:HPt (histidine-containing phosphotransfer) domain-containing protein
MTAWLRRMLGHAGAGDSLPGSLPADPGEDYLHDFEDTFSSEMFVQLLLELPAHRRDIAASWQAGDLQRLRSCVHRLLGAVVYCDAPELESALRELRSALHSGDASRIALQHAHALEVIDRSRGQNT